MPNMPQQHTQAAIVGARKHIRPDADGSKERQAGRQYKTCSPVWRRIRAEVLADEPLCRYCLPRVTRATVVDHIDGDSWNNTRGNLAPCCASCHSRKTAKQDGGYGNRKGYSGNR